MERGSRTHKLCWSNRCELPVEANLQPYSPLPHQRTCTRVAFRFPLLLISQTWNRTKPVEDSSFVNTLQRKWRCDTRIEMHLLNKPSCKKITYAVFAKIRAWNWLGERGLDYSGSGEEPAAGSCEHGNQAARKNAKVAVLVYSHLMMWYFLCF